MICYDLRRESLSFGEARLRIRQGPDADLPEADHIAPVVVLETQEARTDHEAMSDHVQ